MAASMFVTGPCQGQLLLRLWLLLTALGFAAGLQGQTEGQKAFVRREAEATTPAARHAAAHISAEAKSRLGLPPDAEVPRRDALLRARAAVLRRRGEVDPMGAMGDPLGFRDDVGHEAIADMMPPSLLQEASVKSHVRHNSAPSENVRVMVAVPTEHTKVPEWMKYALAEDGTPNVQQLVPTSKTRESIPPEYAKAGLAQEDLLTNFDKEMTRLGVDAEDARAVMEDAQARADPPPPVADGEEATPSNEAEIGESGPAPDPIPAWRDPFAFRFYKFTPLKVRNVAAADSVSLSDFRLWTYGHEMNLKLVSVAYNELGRNPSGEEAMKAVDQNKATKWTDLHMGSIMIILPWNVVATNFAFTTSPDHHERDPVQWYWEGSKNLKDWTMLMGQLSDAGSVSANRETETDMFAWKVDCLVSDWHGWTACNQNCSGGNSTRIRSIQRHSWNDGTCAPDQFFQVRHCNEEPCDAGIEVKAGTQRGGRLGLLHWAALAVAGWRAAR